MAIDNPASHRARTVAQGGCTEQIIAIAAPADAVWTVLGDFAGWPAWNPLYVETDGALVPGRTITVLVALAGMKPQRAHFTVGTMEPPRLIEYATNSLFGLLRVRRYIEIIPTGDGACRVANGEVMGGPIGRLLARLVGGKVRQGLSAMNEGLKAHVEGSA